MNYDSWKLQSDRDANPYGDPREVETEPVASPYPEPSMQAFAGCPLPWSFVDREDKGLEIRAADGDPVLQGFDPYVETPAQAEQIGRLLAAAPELLASLKAAIVIIDHLGKVSSHEANPMDVRRMEDVITKAEGRS